MIARDFTFQPMHYASFALHMDYFPTCNQSISIVNRTLNLFGQRVNKIGVYMTLG